jgi:tape measure domain-containing protein
MASKSSKIEIILSAKDTGLSAALRKGQASLRVFAGQVNSATTPIKSMISGVMSLKTTLAGLLAGAGVASLSQGFISAGQEMSRMRLAFDSISGSSQNAAKEMEFVRTTADQLGLDLRTAAQDYKSISAAAQGTTLAGKGVRDIFVAVAKASTVLGLSSEETSGSLLAISQMISKGKVSAEELRGQLGERLPGAFQIAAQAMGVTTAELDKMMASGQIMADDFIPKFAVAMEQRFGGSAAKAANSFTAASNRLSSEIFVLQSALGEAVTNNTFFVEAMNKVATMLKSLSTDANANAASWRQWAKESALSVLQFVADSSSGFNDIYKSLSFLAGSLKMSYAGALTLGKGFQYLFEQANRLTGNTEKAEYWAKAQADASLMIEKAMAGASKSFDDAEQGSKTLESVTAKITALAKELEKTKADAVNPVEDVAKKAEVEFRQVHGRWVAVEKQIQQTNQETTEQVGLDWGKVWNDMEKGGLSAAEAVDSALDRMARDREVTLRVNEVSGYRSGGPIGGYRLGGLIQSLASGGTVRNILSGGRLSGYGGGDRRLLLGEDGEFMLRKESVRTAGVRAISALNAGRLDIALAELQKRMGRDIGYRLGGLIGSLPEIPVQRLAAGGQVAGGDSGADFGTLTLNLPNGASVPVMTTRESARLLMREFKRLGQRSSS